jgi:hypothetical protein
LYFTSNRQALAYRPIFRDGDQSLTQQNAGFWVERVCQFRLAGVCGDRNFFPAGL